MATPLVDYAAPGEITDVSAHARIVDRLPRDVAGLVRVCNGC